MKGAQRFLHENIEQISTGTSAADVARRAAKIAAAYLLFSAAWILATGYVVSLFFSNATDILAVEVLKGLVFCTFSTLFVYFISRRDLFGLERQMLEQKFHTETTLLHKALDSVGDAVLLIDRVSGKMTYCNRKAAELFDYRRDELIGKNIRMLHASEDSLDTFVEQREQSLDAGSDVHVKTRLQNRRGAPIEAIVSASIMRDLDGMTGIIYIIRDITEEERSATILRESENRYRQLVEELPGALCVCDESGMIREYNREFAGILGYEPGQGVELKQAVTVFDPDGRQLGSDEWPTSMALESKQPVRDAELQIERPDGSRRHTLVNNSLIYSPSGKLEGVVCLITDITSQRVAEMAARRADRDAADSRFRLSQILERLPDAVFVKDRHLKYMEINRAGAELVGLSRSDILGRDDRALFDDATANWLLQKDSEILNSEQITVEQEVLKDQRGDTHLFVVTKGRFLDADGEPAGVFGIARDITEEEELRLALQERVKELRTLYEATLLLAGRGAELDAQLQRIAELIPQGYLKPSATEASIEFRGKQYSTDAFSETSWMMESTIVVFGEPHGTARVARTTVDENQPPYLEEEKHLLDSIALAIGEAAKRADLEQQARQSQKLESIGRLAGGVAHDFNNLLGIILGYVDVSLTAVDRDSRIAVDLRHARDAANRAASLTGQLLAFSRQDAMRPKVLDLNEHTENARKLFSRLIPEDIELTWVPSADPATVRIDPAHCDQILTNLVINASDAISTKGKITVSAAVTHVDDEIAEIYTNVKSGRFVELSVEDTGCGMTEETLAKIFDPFYTTKESGKGTGLGLASVYGIAKQYGGFVTADSQPEQGSCFRVYLPFFNGPAETVSLTEAIESPDGSGTVMLVEDEESLLNLNARLIRDLGYEVIAAASPEHAIGKARDAHGIDLVITDVIMPGMNGLELFDSISRVHPECSCLFVSGYAADILKERGISPDDINFLRKPFTKGKLAVRIRDIMDGRKKSASLN